MNVLSLRPRLAATPALRGFTAIAALMLLTGLGLSRPALAATGLLGQMTTITESPPVAGDALGFNQLLGNTTAVSADGHTALVVAPFAPVGTTGVGKVFIFHYANGQWTQAAELDDPDAASGNIDLFGIQGALSANGTVALIGSVQATVNGTQYAGKVYVYTLSNGTWTLTHTFDDPSATPTPGDLFGKSVGLSADGATAAISALYYGTTGLGEVYIYHKANGTWSQTAAIPDPDNSGNDNFGWKLAVSGDGGSVLVGSTATVNGQPYAGKAYLYTLSNGSWTQAREFDDPNAIYDDLFGYSSVSLSTNGQTAVIGAYRATSSATNSGAAYVYSNASGSWTQTASIADPDAGTGDQFGTTAQISGNGTSVLIGSLAPVSTYAGAGKAYLYTQSNGSWTQTKAFDDPAMAASDFFGASGVSLSGDGQTAVIAAGLTTVNGVSQAGAAYVYQSPADLNLALSAQQASLKQYHTESLDATVNNTDTAVTASNVVLTFPLPSGVGYRGANAAGGQCSANGQTATCTLASLAPGATWQPTVLVTPVTTGAHTATATVVSNEPDPATSNNAASASFKATAWPDGGSVGGNGSSGGGASSPLGLLALLALLSLAGLRRRVLHRNR